MFFRISAVGAVVEEMKRNPENANMEALMQMAQQLEQRMNESLAEQTTQQWLDSQNSKPRSNNISRFRFLR